VIRIGTSLTLILFIAFSSQEACNASDIIVVRITDRVLVEDCTRLGLNIGGDTYYSGAVLMKKRACFNFEGTSYRQCHYGAVQDGRGLVSWCPVFEDWRRILIGGRYTILSGPAKGATGVIKDITTRKVERRGRVLDKPYFVFDRTVPPSPPETGLLVERMRLRDGQFRRLDGYWTSKDNRISIGDVPPESFGCAAVVLDGEKERAHLRFATHYQRYGETNGLWHVRFWAKVKSGAPRLTVSCDRGYGESKSVELASDWRKYELRLLADKVPEPKDPKDNKPFLLFIFEVVGGEVLLDDVEIWMEGDENPTAFRDDLVRTLKKFNPGVLRSLQMGGNTLDNCLAPPIRAYSFTSNPWHKVSPYAKHNKKSYSLHQFYELCEYIGCEPWYCLPGTLSYEEMKHFMEYLGAPADVGYGKLRAELGHPKPWTEVFRHIHIEFGNEAWNGIAPYLCGGFNGKDYWKDLIAIGKSSPYYRKNIVFHAGGQAANPWLNQRILENVPNADRLALAPYVLQFFTKEDARAFDTDDKLFRWVFATPIYRSCDERGAMFVNYQNAKKAGKEISVYEVNHHITRGDGPLEPRNRIVTSIGGGINIANTMLLIMKEHGARTQCLFSLAQHHYNAKGVGAVRLWGTVLTMRKGRERYRPTFLACALANKVIRGDMLETVHSGANPTFSATGVFSKRRGRETLRDLPVLWSYAFSDGDNRGIILINLDTSKAHLVELRFDGGVMGGSARTWLLTADDIAANNEFECAEPRVKTMEETITGFGSGKRVIVPPFSMRVISWRASD